MRRTRLLVAAVLLVVTAFGCALPATGASFVSDALAAGNTVTTGALPPAPLRSSTASAGVVNLSWTRAPIPGTTPKYTVTRTSPDAIAPTTIYDGPATTFADNGELPPTIRDMHPKAVSAGMSHSLALDEDGIVWAWGFNGFGALGDGTNMRSATPVQVAFPAGVKITAIAAGGYHSLAIDSDNVVWAWGYNQMGELGNGTTDNGNSPARVVLANGTPLRATSVAAGFLHSLALDANNGGAVSAWGYNSNGQLGDGTTTNRTRPTPVVLPNGQGIFRASAVSAGAAHSLAIDTTDDHAVYAWGRNTEGQLGNGTATDSPYPGLVGLPDAQHPLQATSIAAGGYHNLAIQTGGNQGVWAWGYNNNGQVGRGVIGDRSLRPVQVPGTDGRPLRASVIAAGDAYSLAVDTTTDRNVSAWGNNASGQLGDGTTRPNNVPVHAVSADARNVTAATIAAGGAHALAIANGGDRSISAWGDNFYAQLGNGASGTAANARVAVATTMTNRTACPLGSGRLIGKTTCSLVAGTGYTYAVTTAIGNWTSVSTPLLVTPGAPK